MLMVLGLPAASEGAVTQVTMQFNAFSPQKVHIAPGDSVTWVDEDSRVVHNVKSDTNLFQSGDMQSGSTYTFKFTKAGYYYYHCIYHGAPQAGMWGVIVVGNPPPPDQGGGGKADKPVIHVPKDFRTIQKAVDHAKKGSVVRVSPGVYHEAVAVKTRGLTIEGVDRFRTILNGRDKKENGIFVSGAYGVKVQNLTVRNYKGNGVFFDHSNHFAVKRVDSIKNRTYGIYAFGSYDGVIKDSFGWGSGDSAFYIGQCLECSTLIEHVHAEKNFLGYSGTNATGVVIRNSVFTHNGAGIVPNTLPSEQLGPNRGTTIIDNAVTRNNYETIPAAGISETFSIPFGTGIWLLGVRNNVAIDNHVHGNKRYGILVTQGIDQNSLPMNNSVLGNEVAGSGKYDLAWDGSGENNCFSGNTFETSGHPDIETTYGCDQKPFAGTPYPPVEADAALSLPNAGREQKEPPDPKRPRCQKGAPDCSMSHMSGMSH
jgi:parallel beta-helix repeat protein